MQELTALHIIWDEGRQEIRHQQSYRSEIICYDIWNVLICILYISVWLQSKIFSIDIWSSIIYQQHQHWHIAHHRAAILFWDASETKKANGSRWYVTSWPRAGAAGGSKLDAIKFIKSWMVSFSKSQLKFREVSISISMFKKNVDWEFRPHSYLVVSGPRHQLSTRNQLRALFTYLRHDLPTLGQMGTEFGDIWGLLEFSSILQWCCQKCQSLNSHKLLECSSIGVNSTNPELQPTTLNDSLRWNESHPCSYSRNGTGYTNFTCPVVQCILLMTASQCWFNLIHAY